MTRSAWTALILVFTLSAVVRLGWVVARHGHAPATLSYPDEEAYQLAGRSLAAGHGLIDEFGYRATYMPAYPAFIAAFERLGLPLLALRLTQAVLAALVAPLTFLLAREWMHGLHGDPRQRGGAVDRPADADDRVVLLIAVLAGAAAAVDPFLIFFSGLLLTEALYTDALVATWWLVVRLVRKDRPASSLWQDWRVAAAVGAGLVVCVMLRPASTILFVIVPAAIVLCRDVALRSILAAGVVVIIAIAGLMPWAARNARVLGEWRWTTTRGGISLYDGLQTGAGGGSDLAHTKRDPGSIGLSELEWDRYWRDRAMQSLGDRPAAVMELAGRKLLRTWNIVPNEPEHRHGPAAWISRIWMTVVLVSAGLGLWQVRRWVRWWVLLLLPPASFTVLHMIFVGSVRYRIPLMPMVFVLSAVGIVRLMWGCRAVGRPVDDAAATNADQEGPHA